MWSSMPATSSGKDCSPSWPSTRRSHAVLGNNDVTLRGSLPERTVVVLDGVRVGLVHDSGPTKGRAARVRRMFPDCDVVVFGHSHAPVDEPGLDGQRLFNPGSPTQRRRQPRPSFGVLDLGGGRVLDHRIVLLDQVART